MHQTNNTFSKSQFIMSDEELRLGANQIKIRSTNNCVAINSLVHSLDNLSSLFKCQCNIVATTRSSPVPLVDWHSK